MELIEMRAIELGEMDMVGQEEAPGTMVASFSEEDAQDFRDSHDSMRDEMADTREAVDALHEELSNIRGPPGRGDSKRGRGPPRRRGADDPGYKMKSYGGPRRPSLHPADLDGDGIVTDEEKEEYRRRVESEDRLWEYD